MTSRVWLGNWMDGRAFPGGMEHENSIQSGKANWAGDKDLRVIRRDGNSKLDFTQGAGGTGMQKSKKSQHFGRAYERD